MNHIIRMNILGLVVAALVLVGIPGYAQSHEAEEHVAEEHSHLHNHHLGLFVGATSKFEEGGEEHHDAHAMENNESSEDGYKTHVLLRIGAGYHFQVGKFSISPVVNLDMWRQHHSLVWGISIGRGF